MKTPEHPSGRDDFEELSRVLTEMNLTAAARHLEELLRGAQEGNPSYSEFLTSVLSMESTSRLERKLARSLKRSNLGAVKTLEEFDFSVRKKLAPAAVKELLSCRWIEEGRSILCVGKSSTGKTHVAKALGHAACMRGYSVFYKEAADLLDELHASFADNTYARVFRRYARADVVICEELGYLPLDAQKADYLYRLVSARHPHRSMIVTSNTGFENWGEFFPSKAQAIATVDRLIDRATILRFTGKKFREPKDIYGDALDSDE